MRSRKKEEEREEYAGRFDYPDGGYYEGQYTTKVSGSSDTGGATVVGKRSSSPTHAPGAKGVAPAPSPVESTAKAVLLQAGLGVYRDSSGASFEGHWRDGKPSGPGLLSLPSGAVYCGSFNDCRFHGFGRYQWADGAYYEGEWENNLMHGVGIYVDAAGTRWRGRFQNGTCEQAVAEEYV